MSSLYALTNDILAATEQLMDMDAAPEVIRDTLESISGDFEQKAANVVAFSRDLDYKAAARKAEAERMLETAKREEKRAKELRAYVLDCMKATNIQKVNHAWFTLSIAKNPASVVIDDESLIPKDYFTDPVPPLPAVDKKLIAQAIKDGNVVPGAHTEQGLRLSVK